MYFNNNEYSVPVVLCSDVRKGFLSAISLLRSSRTRPHVFSNKFSLRQRILFKCHLIDPFSCEAVAASLVAFASELDEHYTPILLLSDSASREIVEHYQDELDAYFIIVDDEVFLKGEIADDYC